MKSKNEMTLQKVTCTNSCQHAIDWRSSPFVTFVLFNNGWQAATCNKKHL